MNAETHHSAEQRLYWDFDIFGQMRPAYDPVILRYFERCLEAAREIPQEPAPGSPEAERPNLCPGCQPRTFVGAVACTECREGWNWPEAVAQAAEQIAAEIPNASSLERGEELHRLALAKDVTQAAQAIRTLSSLPREVVLEASVQAPTREPVSMVGLRKQRDASIQQAGKMLEGYKAMLAERDAARAGSFAMKLQRDGLADALEAIRGEIAKTYGPDRVGADACVTWIDDCAWVALRRIGRAFAIFALLWALGWPAFAQTIFGPARVIDGDTLEVAGQKVRLHGVDAPELRQICTRPEFNGHSGSMENSRWACGVAARGRLEELIDGRPVTCQPLDKDRYGRVVARCYVDLSVGTPGRPHAHMDLGGWMVRQGYAVAYTKYSRDYLPQEAVARGAKLGLWSGSFVAPAEWRRGQR